MGTTQYTTDNYMGNWVNFSWKSQDTKQTHHYTRVRSPCGMDGFPSAGYHSAMHFVWQKTFVASDEPCLSIDSIPSNGCGTFAAPDVPGHQNYPKQPPCDWVPGSCGGG